jgi:phytoene synthase
MSSAVPLPEPTAGDVEVCRAVTAHHSRSFYAASHLLAGDARSASLITYAFCRAADDDVDDAPTLQMALERHQRTRERLTRIYAGEAREDPVGRAFEWVVKTFAVPMEEPMALLHGMAMDLGPVRTADEDALLLYCYRAAGVVGRIMSRILGRSDEVALRHAVDLGVAMQLTNIARDVGEDARRDRVYLPSSWLLEAGGSADEVLRGALTPATRTVTLRVLQLAEDFYRSGMAGIRLLPWTVRPAIAAAALIYRQIGVKVAARGGDGVTTRARVGGAEKLWLAVRALAGSAAGLLTPEPSTHDRRLHAPLLRGGIQT